jgi:ferric-dicitrate binding protein FerR (iron transport regulator)
MNAERFETLADAYGGDIAHWPAAEQDEARAWSAAHPDAADILVQADALDALLSTADRFKPGLEFQQRVVASFPRRPALVSRPRTWVSGAALAAACAAGVIIGVNFSDRLLSDPATESAVQTATAFDGTSYFATESAG